MEIPPGLVNIPRDLFAQRVHRWKLNLVPQALQEKDLNLGVGLQFDGMKIQQVGLNGK